MCFVCTFVCVRESALPLPASRIPGTYIQKCKRKQSPGPDEIPAEFLKEIEEEQIKEITEALNVWWDTGDIPEEEPAGGAVLAQSEGRRRAIHGWHRVMRCSI